MQAFGVGDAGNHNLPFRIMSRARSWGHQDPYCCNICSKPEPPEPELQRVVHTQIKRVAGNGELLPNCEASFHALSLARGALLSTHQLLTMIRPGRLQPADSNVAKKIKVEESSAKIGLAFYHPFASSTYAKKYDAGGRKLNGAG